MSIYAISDEAVDFMFPTAASRLLSGYARCGTPEAQHEGGECVSTFRMHWLVTTIPVVQFKYVKMAVCQNLVPLVNIKIAGKWMFIPLKIVLIGIDPYPNSLKNGTVRPCSAKTEDSTEDLNIQRSRSGG